MNTEFYCAYRILLCLLSLVGTGYWAFRCAHTLPRVLVVLMGCALLCFNEPISAFLFPILVTVLGTLAMVFLVILLIVLISGHTAGSVFQRFNIFRR